MVFENRAGARWIKALAFCAGLLTASFPLLWLLLQSPGQVRFDVFDYHFFYRQVHWSKAIQHDVEVMFAWLDSSQALLLGLLATAGLLFVRFQSGWTRERRSEAYLCAWLSAALTVHLCPSSSDVRALLHFDGAVPRDTRVRRSVLGCVETVQARSSLRCGCSTHDPDRH